uniref:Uncharacterized protein n=1 Tax=Oryza nivara TaxID=4536 RepID=A0A0E0I7Y0_ORYNI
MAMSDGLDVIEQDLDRATCLISDGDIASVLPSNAHGAFLKMFLGPVNLWVPRKEVQLKTEYNSYRVCYNRAMNNNLSIDLYFEIKLWGSLHFL